MEAIQYDWILNPASAGLSKSLHRGLRRIFSLGTGLSVIRNYSSSASKLIWCLIVGMTLLSPLGASSAFGESARGQGALTIIEPDGKPGGFCPLEHTTVKVNISGFIAQVAVTQIFHNPGANRIEAIYTFPLSSKGAVNDMQMKIGDRTIKGLMKTREEAKQIYEQAKQKGQTASLLDQERPNIFTQSVANIPPGAKVEITIRYNELLPYDDGAFKFAFPTVVGPRFIPGAPAGKAGSGWASDTKDVPDAGRITPSTAREGVRAGHDIDIHISIDADVPIGKITSELHEVTTNRSSPNKANVTLVNKKEIPNRDFILKYQAAADKIQSGVIAHKAGNEGYVAVIMLPPKKVTPAEIAPRELIFVIDCSGSQFGLPLEKAKETMRFVIDKMSPKDTFNIIDFNVGARMLFSEPKPNTKEYREKALAYLAKLEAKGGTWMKYAVESVMKTTAPDNRLRVITFMTDGYVGNDFEIIDLVQKYKSKARWFPFGTGNSVNRFLLDKIAQVGGGEAEYILLNSPGEEVAAKFYKRIAAPVLTDITLTTAGIELTDMFPSQIADLWADRPLVFKAKYAKGGSGSITIKGNAAGKTYEQTINVNLPESEENNAAIGSVWARAKVDDLMTKDWMGMQTGHPSAELKQQIISVALAHKIMTQYTSFVAVEEKINPNGGELITIPVPVELPHGVSEDRIFGGVPGGARTAPAMAPKGVATSRFFLNPVQGRRPESKVNGPASPSEAKWKGNEPTEAQESAKQQSDHKDEVQGPSKLSQKLQKLYNLTTKGADTSQLGIKIENGRIKISIKASVISVALMDKLEAEGFSLIRKTNCVDKLIVGTIAVDKLKVIERISAIISIDLSKDASK